MSEHPLDRELRMLIDSAHRRTTAFCELANILSDARRLEQELDLEARLAAIVQDRAHFDGGPIQQPSTRVTGVNGANGIAHHPQNPNTAPAGGYSLREALSKAALEQSPYPEDTTYNAGVPEQYRKTYSY